MSLQFVLGSSGSGKSDMTYQNIVSEAARHQDRNYLIIVPEQFTLQTQQKLVELAPNHVIMNIDVLSFKRLAYRVFDDLGISSLQILEETGKNLILRKVAEDRQEELTVMRENLRRIGYIDEVKSLISEFVQYDITPEKLEAYIAASRLAPSFEARLKDVITIYRGFNHYMEDRYITAEEVLNVLITVADQSALLRDSVLVFDEYTGFTPIQNKLIRKLLPITSLIQVILTVDQRENVSVIRGSHELFYLTKKTIRSLTRMAEELQVAVLPPVYTPDSRRMRFAKVPDIAFLEKNLFRSWYQVSREKPDNIRMISSRNPVEELLFTAREIRRLVQEEGYRYRDIAVVTGAVESYAPYAEEIFDRYDIHYYLDQTVGVVFHPFIETIRAILEIIADDFSYEAIFRFLRSGFSGIEDDAIDRLDYYVSALGLKGKKAWSSRWGRTIETKGLCELEEMEVLRRQIMELLDPMIRADRKNAGEKILALYQVLQNCAMEQQLWAREKELLEAGDQTRSKEYGQLYPIVMSLLEKYYELLGNEEMNTEEFAEILDAGLSAASVATVPPGYDSVTIGDLERTRLNQIRVLFLLGVNDGVVPKAAGTGGIISEFEREMMQEAKLEMAPGAREQSFIQRFYLYRILTKPSEKLYLSCSHVDMEGKTIRPSYLIQAMNRLFPALVTEIQEDLVESLSLATPKAAMEYLVHGEHDEAWYALAAYFYKKEEDATLRLIDASYLSLAPDPISRVVAEALYGHQMRGSVTRLEQFAACAYAHFLRYGLKLKERESSDYESRDLGTLYHNALERYGRKLEKSPYDWFKVPEEERLRLGREAFLECVEQSAELSSYAKGESAHQVERMLSIFQQTLWALTRQVRAGRFEPTEFEMSFAQLTDKEDLRVELDRDHTMLLYGRIDRLDLCRDQGQYYVKIVDYKSGNEHFDLIRVYHGLSLQLMVYMNTAVEYVRDQYHSDRVLPAAVLYHHIDDPVITEMSDEELTEEDLEQKLLEALKPGGLVNREEAIYRAMDEHFEKKSDVIPVSLNKDGSISKASKVASTEEFDIIRRYVMERLKAAGKRIYAGDISINPYEASQKDSCAYCPYSGICGVKSALPGPVKRNIRKMDDSEIIEAMRTANEMAGE